MARPVLIPPALFEALAVLDRRCDFSFSREDQTLAMGAGKGGVDPVTYWTRLPLTPARPLQRRRAWTVQIILRGGETYDRVNASEPALTDALAAALSEAYRRHWHVPAGTN